MKRILVLLLASVFVFGVWGTSVLAADNSSEIEQLKQEVNKLLNRLEQLEKKQNATETKTIETEKKVTEVEKVTTKIEKEEAALKEEKKTRVISYYRDGWFLETPDKNFRLNISGVLHFDTRLYEAKGSSSSIDIRRARYDMRGYLYRGDIEHLFRLQLEMADQPYLRNAYWMLKFRPELNIQLGQFKIPIGGADFLTEEAHLNFVEYGVDSPVAAFFDRGINIHSFFLDGRVQTNLGVFTGAGTDLDSPAGDLDSTKDYAARLLLVPFKKSDNKFLKGLHFAGGYERGLQSIKTTRGETNNRTENFESRWYRWRQNFVDLDKRTRYGGEFHWLVGPATLSYEFNRVQWDDITVDLYPSSFNENWKQNFGSSNTPTRVPFPGDHHSDVHQVWLSYFLTGEQKTFEDVFFCWRQPKPKKNFSLKDGTWGAWEVLARYAYHTNSSDLFNQPRVTVPGVGAVDPSILEGSQAGYSLTGGIRWIWNPKTRIMIDANYLKSTKGDGIQIVDQKNGVSDQANSRYFKDSESAVLMRIIFTP